MGLFSRPIRVASNLRQRATSVVSRWSASSREDLRRSWYLHVDTQVSELPELSRSTKKVYEYFANLASRDGFCDPSAEDVANQCLISLPAATHAIKELQRLRLLVSVLRVGRPGRTARAYYVVRAGKGR